MNKDKCLNPNCPRPPKMRGLCQACYGSARRLVVENKTTWDALVKAGKCLESARPRYSKTIEWLTS